MKLALVLLGAANVVADCMQQAATSMGDASFNWLVSGSSADRQSNVSAICASPSNPARDNFNAKLETFKTACVPAGGESSAIALTLNLLNTTLCSQKQDSDGNLHYCVLSLLPLFDFAYFIQLSQATSSSYPAPPLQSVGDSPDRQNALCASSVCNAYMENVASALLAAIPPASALAADFIRNIVSRPRCGCAVEQTVCESTEMTNALITTDGSGVRTFVDGKACENGVLTACARTWVNCEHIPLPACAATCAPAGHSLVNITFRLTNLDYTCLQAQLPNNMLQTIQTDMITNIAGLLQSDFSCTCDAATGTNTGTQCNCLVTCASLNLVKNLNLPQSLVNLTNHAAAIVVPTPNLDKQVIASCQIVNNNASFGSSFELLGLQTDFPENSAASATLVGLSVAASICFSFVL